MEKASRIQGWFGLLLKNRLIPGGTDILDPAIVPSGPIQIFDRQGVPATLTLRRSTDQTIFAEPILKVVKAPRVADIPAGFPVPPETDREPISVVEFLQQRIGAVFDRSFASEEDHPWDEADDGAELGLWVHRILQVLPLDADESQIGTVARREAGLLFGQSLTIGNFGMRRDWSAVF